MVDDRSEHNQDRGAALERAIERLRSERFVVPLRDGGAGDCALLCVHTMSGHASVYARLARCMDQRFDVYATQAIPLFLGTARADSLHHMAAACVEEFLAMSGTRAVVVFGYCVGGLIAGEIAAELAARGRPPRLLAIADTFYPIPGDRSLAVEPKPIVWTHFIEAFLSRAIATQIDDDRSFWALPYAQRLQRVTDLARSGRNALLSRRVDVEALEKALMNFRTYVYTMHTPTPRAYAGDVLQVRSSEFCDVWALPNLLEQFLVGNVTTKVLQAKHWELVSGAPTADVASLIHDLSRTIPATA